MTILIILLSLCFLIIAFLIFQIHALSVHTRDTSFRDQDAVVLVARLLVKSATQSHPLFALEHASKADFILDDLTRRYGNLPQAENILKLHPGKLQQLHGKVQTQIQQIQNALMSVIVDYNPRLESPLNADAGLVLHE